MASIAKFDQWQNSAGTTYGTVLQIKSTNITTTVSANTQAGSSLGGDVGLNVTITPLSSTSKFLITVNVGIGTCEGNTWTAILSRDGTRIGRQNSTGHPGCLFRGVDHTGNTGSDVNHGVGGSGSWMDETSGVKGTPITFKCGFVSETGSVYINRVESDYSSSNDHIAGAYSSSTITVMEIEK